MSKFAIVTEAPLALYKEDNFLTHEPTPFILHKEKIQGIRQTPRISKLAPL